MDVRYHRDPETGLPHIYDHGVTEEEVESILANPMTDDPSTGDSRIAAGQTSAGRFLRVVYVPDDDDEGIFVVTAYPIDGKQLKAFRKRKRRRKR